MAEEILALPSILSTSPAWGLDCPDGNFPGKGLLSGELRKDLPLCGVLCLGGLPGRVIGGYELGEHCIGHQAATVGEAQMAVDV
jgi:hypothetical protein